MMTPRTPWRPRLGAWPGPEGTSFDVWAPTTGSVELVVDERAGAARVLDRGPDGHFTGTFPEIIPGDRYWFRLDGRGPFPDPASRFQPDGVHGPSMVVDPTAYAWSDAQWTGRAMADLAIYELHIGTFTPDGTFGATEARLPYLRDLGVTAIEIMPVADFPGVRNWGYDGAALFAPARCYGRPDELRRLIDVAHRLDLAVLLDVVYNHTGPDGAYLNVFSPYYFTSRHSSPWGAGVNLDGEHSSEVRHFLIENALHWVHEYHVDGLRLDATHAIHDDSPRHFLAELTDQVKSSSPKRTVVVIAEDHRNLAQMVRPVSQTGWGLDAVWADDFHHEVRRLVAGDSDGYYRDYTGSTADIAATVNRGWFFTGQHSSYLNEVRGSDPSGIDLHRFVVCLQNHDQVGNRAFGERLHHQIDLAAFRAASVLLLTLPETPLLFMGQEWAASSPFLYFTDHGEPLGRLVTEGRRREFERFTAFADPAMRARIPDPQSPHTFEASQLHWNETSLPPHAGVLALYRELLALRKHEPALGNHAAGSTYAEALDAGTIAVWRSRGADRILVAARLVGSGSLRLPHMLSSDEGSPGRQWKAILVSEEPRFATGGAAPTVELADSELIIHFPGPAAVIFKAA